LLLLLDRFATSVVLIAFFRFATSFLVATRNETTIVLVSPHRFAPNGQPTHSSFPRFSLSQRKWFDNTTGFTKAEDSKILAIEAAYQKKVSKEGNIKSQSRLDAIANKCSRKWEVSCDVWVGSCEDWRSGRAKWKKFELPGATAEELEENDKRREAKKKAEAEQEKKYGLDLGL